ncbi:unnamed protein product [Pleuronectes platessa]|uniref:Uncharacterized protein n=1 Tax=Pleuronectes platessa TaxID=8262 RepID=A0A9N7VF49_PLEPL|nr:unnamed protein product [Pleuronectes platessa]
MNTGEDAHSWEIEGIPAGLSTQLPPLTDSTGHRKLLLGKCVVVAARDKLPRGLYAVSLSLYSRLGGSALAWRREKEEHQWAVTTEPVEHRGRFHDTNLHVNQSLFTVRRVIIDWLTMPPSQRCWFKPQIRELATWDWFRPAHNLKARILPAAREVVPSMVLIFQLIALPGASSHVSSVVAWGAISCLPPGPRPRAGQVKRLPSGGPEHGTTALPPPANPPVEPRPDGQHDPLQSQLPLQPQPSSQPQLPTQSIHPQSHLYPQQQPHAGPSGGAGEPAAVYSHRGSPLHLSADSACSSSSLPECSGFIRRSKDAEVGDPNAHKGSVPNKPTALPERERESEREGAAHDGRFMFCHTGQKKGSSLTHRAYTQPRPSRTHIIAASTLTAHHFSFVLYFLGDAGKNSSSGAISGNTGEKGDPCGRVRAEGGIHHKKKPIKKTNSCGPSVSSGSAPPRQAGKQRMRHSVENLSTEEMEEYTFSLHDVRGISQTDADNTMCPEHVTSR